MRWRTSEARIHMSRPKLPRPQLPPPCPLLNLPTPLPLSRPPLSHPLPHLYHLKYVIRASIDLPVSTVMNVSSCSVSSAIDPCMTKRRTRSTIVYPTRKTHRDHRWVIVRQEQHLHLRICTTIRHCCPWRIYHLWTQLQPAQ